MKIFVSSWLIWLPSSAELFPELLRLELGDERVENVIELPLASNQERAIYVAALNAVVAHRGIETCTVHCKDDEPEECGPTGRIARMGDIRYNQLHYSREWNPLSPLGQSPTAPDPVTGINPDIDLTPADSQRSISRRHSGDEPTACRISDEVVPSTS